MKKIDNKQTIQGTKTIYTWLAGSEKLQIRGGLSRLTRVVACLVEGSRVPMCEDRVLVPVPSVHHFQGRRARALIREKQYRPPLSCFVTTF